VDYDALVSTYRPSWISRDKVASQDGELSIYSICADQAGWQSDMYQLDIVVEPNTPVIITNLNPTYINLEQPILKVKTNRPAECAAEYDGEKEDMYWQVINNENIYTLSVSAFSNLEFEDGQSYEFKVTCEATDNDDLASQTLIFTITSDLRIPRIDIGYPPNPFISTLSSIDVHVSTEMNTTVDLENNDSVKSSMHTDTGSLIFYNFLLTKGHNRIVARAIDKAGNVNSSELLSVYYSGAEDYPVVDRIFPEDNTTLSKVDTLVAYVWTAYGADLDMSASTIRLFNDEGNEIFGDLSFVPGDIADPIGNLTLELTDTLIDGDYSWEIHVTDEYDRSGDTVYATFSINKATPVIMLELPLELSTDESYDGDPYQTNKSNFILKGSVSSTSAIKKDKTKYKWKNENTKDTFEKQLALNNNLFEVTVDLDALDVGEVNTYTFTISTENQDGLSQQLIFTVVYDRKAPVPNIYVNQ